MPEFDYTELLPLAADDTVYRLLSRDGVKLHSSFCRNFRKSSRTC